MTALLILAILALGPKAPKAEGHLQAPAAILAPATVTVTAWLTDPGFAFRCARVTYAVLAGEFPVAGEEPLQSSSVDADEPCDPYAQEDRIPVRVSFPSRTFRFGRGAAGDFRIRATFEQGKATKRVERVVRVR